MRQMKWVGIAAAGLMIVSCFLTWVTVPSRDITVTGIDATGTSFGSPGYFHLLLTLFFVIFNLLPKLWAKRSNLVVTAINMAWAIRNYFLITACRGGDCPQKHAGMYLVLLACALMLVAALFPDIRIADQSKPLVENRADGDEEQPQK